MLLQIVGNSPATAYLAIQAQKRGHVVDWVTSGFVETFRPIRLRESTVKNLRKLWGEHQLDLGELLQCPELHYWGPLEGGLTQSLDLFLSPELAAEDKWFDYALIAQRLKYLAAIVGVNVVTERKLPVPNFNS